MLDQKLAEAMQHILSRDEERFTLTRARESLIEVGIPIAFGHLSRRPS